MVARTPVAACGSFVGLRAPPWSCLSSASVDATQRRCAKPLSDNPRSRCWGSHYDVGEVTLVSDSTALLLAWLEYLAVLLVLGVVLLRRSR